MMGLTRSTLIVLFSLLLILQPLANAQDQAQGRPGASAPAPAAAAGRPGSQSYPPDQVPIQPSASAPAPASDPAAGRPGAPPSTPPADQAQPRPKVYSCPADNGARYTTANGVTFELKCDHGTIAKPLGSSITNTQKECADYCSTLPNCQSADWNDKSKLCATKQEYIPTFPLPGTHTWFPLEERKQRPDTEYRTPPECPAPKIALAESVTASASFTADGECPNNDGKTFLTPQGTYFQVKCGAQNTASIAIPGSRPLHDFAECMTACADIPECKSVTFNGGKPNWDCKFFETGVEALVADATKNKASAIVIDPPTSQKADDLTFLCSTECPNADGQTWESETGEVSSQCEQASLGVEIPGTVILGNTLVYLPSPHLGGLLLTQLVVLALARKTRDAVEDNNGHKHEFGIWLEVFGLEAFTNIFLAALGRLKKYE
ncbi:hypothetical protein NHQ30_003709 [Ciborinia camelliae]|nr:hypothetical protein NHQ30_003709 [Ciborinia camelliae]